VEEVMRRSRTVSFAACFVCLILSCARERPADAQDFLGKPIRILVGVAAGGATDVTARLIAQKLSASLHTNVYVENKTGGAFEPVFRELTNAAPDGRTLFMISAAMVVNQAVHKDYPFDLRKMTAVTEVSEGPFILVGRKGATFKTVNELVDFGRKNPGKVTFGSGGGAGSSLSLTAELLRLRAGITIVNAPYKGAAAALNDLLGEHIDAMFDAMPVQVGQVKAGNVIGLAVTSAKRTEALPDVPTMVEAGYKDFVVSNYFGLIAPPDMPLAVAKRLRDEVSKAVADPEVAGLFNQQGMTPVANEPGDFGSLIKSDLERWTAVINDAGIERQ
jgi:tripartite-type tricarboxylate transporter receptor subunit TctC